MEIRRMFVKPIDRDIKGVIKVGQADDENIRQELEEYVVTREMQKHFAEFVASYLKGVNHYTDKMGVWISGFFGSGKSHFLKILSYLLENKVVDDKPAYNYFDDDKKIKDAMVLGGLKMAASVPTDVILFNIDSKSSDTGKQTKDAIVSVFLKVFNEMQGFSGTIPMLADLERELTAAGRYHEFQEYFLASRGQPWLAERHKFDFIQDNIVEALADMGFMSETAAWNWCEKATEPYSISIEDFAKRVKAYLDGKERNHHIVFLVDEVGQYIGDNSKLMLNLQTVTEDLGTFCQGKAWVIVTSQQDIDAIAKDMGLRSSDFSKIQGRFDTRLSLSSANVDEVIKKRILEKNQTADETLRLLYEQNETVIKNLIVFNDGVEKKLYRNAQEFANVYPFVPYQFDLLGSVLTSIRQRGASGKHLSEGERSMLALFKESAMTIMDKEAGALVPFNVFYDALHQFLDHSHKNVIIKAYDNRYINPNADEDCFNVNVLKTLFLIKYVKEITANVDNIVSLMVDSIYVDRMALRKRVEKALEVLVRQTLVQKNNDVYVFLTDEEQEINREIERQTVEMNEVVAKVGELVFADIYPSQKYRYPEFNGRYNFAFNQIVDDRPYKANQNHDIGVRVITPSSEYGENEATLRMMSGEGKEVLVVLPNDAAFLEEIRIALRIAKYLHFSSGSPVLAKHKQIRDAKTEEMGHRNANAKLFLEESLKQADIYVNGDKMPGNAKDVVARINEALERLVTTVYHKLPYIDAALGEVHIRKLFSSSHEQSITLTNERPANANALRDVLDYIALNSSAHTKTSLKSLMDRFMKAPYGFIEDDVEWLVAYLFKTGEIAFTLNGISVTTLNKTADEIVRYITKREYVEKLLTERREKASEGQKKSVRDVAKELFGSSTLGDDDDAMMQNFQKYAESLRNEVKRLDDVPGKGLPGKRVLATGKALLNEVLQLQAPSSFFADVHARYDDFLDFADDYEPVKAFYSGEQLGIFERGVRLMDIYEESKTFVLDDEVEDLVQKIQDIMKKEAPYSDIPKLPDLLDRFSRAYTAVLEGEAAPIREKVDFAKQDVVRALTGKPYEAEMRKRSNEHFADIYKKLDTCNNVATLQIIEKEADVQKSRLLNEMIEMDRELEEERRSQLQAAGVEPAEIVKQKRRRSISFQSVNVSRSWQVETPEDVDKYISALRDKILRELADDTVVNIEF